MISSGVTKYTCLPCHARDVAETEFVSKIIPEWSSFSGILKQEYELVGSPIDWSLVNGSHLPPVENQVVGSGTYTRYLTSLQETYIMKPVKDDRSFDKYFTVYFFVVAHHYATAQPKNYSGSYGFKVGNSLEELEQIHRSIELPTFVNSWSSTTQKIATGRVKIMLTQDVLSLSYEADSSTSFFADMWFSSTGDIVSGKRNKVIIGGTLMYSGSTENSSGGDAHGRVFDDTITPTSTSGAKGSRYNVTRAILPTGIISSDLTLSLIVPETTRSGVVKNYEGSETIIPGPYFIADNVIHSNAFYKTPFFFTYASEASPGSRQVVDGVSYFGSNTSMYNTGTNSHRKYFQAMVREFPA